MKPIYHKSEAHYTNLEKARKVGMEIKVDCLHCGQTSTKCGITNHQKNCIKNPDRVNKDSVRMDQCPVCDTEFLSKKAHGRWKTTCSYACSNVHFRSGKDNGQWNPEASYHKGQVYYRRICFRHHDKKCVICGEDNIVAVHHMDEDHKNNSPENLIPLCPTHHIYVHSKYKNLVEPIINEYIKEWSVWKDSNLRPLSPKDSAPSD